MKNDEVSTLEDNVYKRQAQAKKTLTMIPHIFVYIGDITSTTYFIDMHM